MVGPRKLLLLLSLAACGGDDSLPPVSDGAQGPTPLAPGGSSFAGSSGTGAPEDPGPNSFYKVGDALNPEIVWEGYPEGSDEKGPIRISDFHDPDGAKGIRALLITEGQVGCAPCLLEAKDLSKNLPEKWNAMGVKVIQLMVANAANAPATISDAFNWKKKVNATWVVAADPTFTFAEAGSNPYPLQIIVDPRTLVIVDRIEGYRAKLPEIEALAEKNL